jgi:nitroreductase
MDVVEAIHKRRALRTFDARPVEPEKIAALVEAMRLSPSCNNNQPWRVVVCRDPDSLAKAKSALSKGNAYATRVPLTFVVAATVEGDCRSSDSRDYFLFGCGLAVGIMTLRATELGLTAHPIAGFDPLVLKRELGIPPEYVVITMVNTGYPGTDQSLLSDKQKTIEMDRPERKPISENFFDGHWGKPLNIDLLS